MTNVTVKTALLHLLARTLGAFHFYPLGEGREIAHHRSKRKPSIVYADAVRTPYFCNLRLPSNLGDKQGVLTEEAIELIGECLLDLVYAGGWVSTIAGIPNAGKALAVAVVAAASRRGKVLENIHFLKTENEQGTAFVSADARTDWTVDAIVDDAITLADTKLRFLAAVQKPGAVKPTVCILFDREEGGVEILTRMGYSVRTTFGLEDILGAHLEAGVIDQETAARIRLYAADRRELVERHMGEILADLRDRP